MPQQRDNRYRGRSRRKAPPQRKPGHLRTNYSEDEPYLFQQDLEKVRAVWPEEVRREDSRAVRRHNLKVVGITMACLMVPVTVFTVWIVIQDAMPWWIVPAAQTVILLYFGLMCHFQFVANKDENIDIPIHREADRRGIKYDSKTPLYALMNRINADYNNTLWNRNFKWQ